MEYTVRVFAKKSIGLLNEEKKQQNRLYEEILRLLRPLYQNQIIKFISF